MNIQHMNNLMPQVKAPEVKGKKDEELMEACEGFESMLITQMLKSMRGTLAGDGLLDGGTGMDIYKSMHDQYLSEEIAGGERGIGISDVLYSQLSKE